MFGWSKMERWWTFIKRPSEIASQLVRAWSSLLSTVGTIGTKSTLPCYNTSRSAYKILLNLNHIANDTYSTCLFISEYIRYLYNTPTLHSFKNKGGHFATNCEIASLVVRTLLYIRVNMLRFVLWNETFLELVRKNLMFASCSRRDASWMNV